MQDTKDRITPVAFAPAESVMNLPLARPWRRGGAMLCDLAVIALLTELDNLGLLLFLVVMWLWHKSHLMKQLEYLGRYRVWIVRSVSLLVIFASMAMIYHKQNTVTVIDDNSAQKMNLAKTIGAVGLIISAQSCDDVPCVQEVVTDFIELGLSIDTQLTHQSVLEFIDDTVDTSLYQSQQIEELKTWSLIEYQAIKQRMNIDESSQTPAPDLPAVDQLDDNNLSEQSNSHSPMRWFIGLIEDLGLGFGFAAVYFSCFTAWFNGQTFGKMLFNIKVIQLNDTKISLWESFGRYGGYGAGFATGLLGFVQIYWDPNRQAIQDKISATVVIDVGLKNKEALQKISEQATKPQDSHQLTEQ